MFPPSKRELTSRVGVVAVGTPRELPGPSPTPSGTFNRARGTENVGYLVGLASAGGFAKGALGGDFLRRSYREVASPRGTLRCTYGYSCSALTVYPVPLRISHLVRRGIRT